MLLNVAIETYKKHLEFRDLSINTINGYMKELRYLREYLELVNNSVIYIEDILLEDLESYIRSRIDTGIVTSSINRTISIIKGLFEYLVSRELLDKNPTLRLESYRQVNRPKKDTLTQDEVTELIDAIDNDLIKYAVYTLANTGLRISELYNLKNDHILFDESLILVENGKGGKNRIIPMNTKLMETLIEYRDEVRLKDTDMTSEYFFASERSGRLSRQWMNTKIKEAVDSLEWEKDISSHNLRHTFATNLVNNDANIVSIQKLLGHSDLRTTSVYLNQSMDDLKDAVELL